MRRIKRSIMGAAEDLTEGLRKGFRGDDICRTLGMKVRSRKRGRGPIGVPRYTKKRSNLKFGNFKNLGY